MLTFKDSQGGEWKLDFTFGNLRRVAKASKFNLLDPYEPLDGDVRPLFQRLYQDEGELYDCLWLFVEPQAKERGVSEDRFGELMAAECFHDMQVAFFKEWADFFRRLQRLDKAEALQQVAEAHQQLIEQLRKPGTSTAIASQTAKRISQVFTTICGGSEASSA